MEELRNNSLNFLNQTMNFFNETRSNAYFKKFTQHRIYSIYFPIEQVFSWYSLLLIVVGTICNLTSFLILTRKNIRKHSCMRYLSILTLSDTLVLYQWNLATFYKYNFSFPPKYLDLEDISIFWCRCISYLAFTSLQLSAWLLCAVSVDRVMIIYAPRLQTYINNKKCRINCIIASIVCAIFLLNSHILVLNGFTVTEQTSTTNITHVICYQSKSDNKYMNPKWQRVHLFFYNIIPFSIMLACNLLIIYNVKFGSKVKSKTKSSSKRKNRMTFLLLLITFSFMFLTLPSVIVHSFFRDFLSDKPYRRLVNILVGNLLHTSHTINFFFYIFSAPNFQLEFNNAFQFFFKYFRTTPNKNPKTNNATKKTSLNVSKSKQNKIQTQLDKKKMISDIKIEKRTKNSLLNKGSGNSSFYDNCDEHEVK